ncbi:hypothetical protein KG265_001077 [Listeria monocytogenes]|nr:hypothetical protein [Listeria monocytogenes]EHM8264528.1 hypothetical protein [Listeria monocytogenes]EIA7135349.1 hypothetical protein [Listeria monocytogenes]EIA7327827.1 hypothetical protein [Listeria monocytogenes]EIA7600645.1 hypothetical protein [Listeria monocytogenes]
MRRVKHGTTLVEAIGWLENDRLEVNLFYYIYNLDEKRENEDDFFAFIVDDYVKPLETLVSMQYGYYVQKEVIK